MMVKERCMSSFIDEKKEILSNALDKDFSDLFLSGQQSLKDFIHQVNQQVTTLPKRLLPFTQV